MAEIVDNDVDVGSGDVIVERKIVHRRSAGASVLAAIVVLAFVATCVVVFWGDRMGLRTPAPATVVVTPPPAPTPAP